MLPIAVATVVEALVMPLARSMNIMAAAMEFVPAAFPAAGDANEDNEQYYEPGYSVFHKRIKIFYFLNRC